MSKLLKLGFKIPKVKYVGVQEGIGKIPSFKLYNVDWPGHPRDRSTVSSKTLKDLFTKKANQEYAPGLPTKGYVTALPSFTEPRKWEMDIQHHEANVAGPHKDLRIVDPQTGIAHSWVIQGLPRPGEKALAIRQSDHTQAYSRWSGTIDSGYGAGKVSLFSTDEIEVLKSSPDKITFAVHKGLGTERYTLIKAFDNKNWLLVNHTHTRTTHPEIPDFKPKYKDISPSSLDPSDTSYFSPKVDGAHALFVLRSGKPIDVYSYRKSKRSDRLIDHSFKTSLYRTLSPKSSGKLTVLRGELFGVDKQGKTIPSTETAGILNSSTWHSRELQAKTGPLSNIVFDVDTFRGKNVSNLPYSEKLRIIKQITAETPGLNPLPLAKTTEEKRILLQNIQANKLPLTSEGIVRIDPSQSVPEKAKLVQDTEVYVKGTFPAKPGSKYNVGGFLASNTLHGPANIRIGTGLSDALRAQAHSNPQDFINRLAKITYQEKYKSDKYRMPVFKEWRELY